MALSGDGLGLGIIGDGAWVQASYLPTCIKTGDVLGWGGFSIPIRPLNPSFEHSGYSTRVL